jgi:bifunctional enzyme CysN/CysC
MSHERLDLVVVGHVDHGKSTVVGRLLADTGALPIGKLEEVKARCLASARPFEYAFLLDALKAEQAQGITIDAARCFFKTANRHVILNDAPGHIEFLKNMITGAARAQAALLVIDAKEGIRENSMRHGYLVSLLGIKQVCVLINKMDLVGFSEETYETLKKTYGAFLDRLGVHNVVFLPIAALIGANIAEKSKQMPWFSGPTVLEQIDRFSVEDDRSKRPLRLGVQDIYKFTADGDERRIIVGSIESGTLRAGDTVVFAPSGKR